MADAKKKILIVEDDLFSLKLSTARLSDEGYEVIATPRAAEALRLAESHNPQLVIVDLMLQDGDGFAVIEQLRVLPGCATTPIVAHTNLEQETDREEALRKGANAYLVKSNVLFQDVVDTIKKLLG